MNALFAAMAHILGANYSRPTQFSRQWAEGVPTLIDVAVTSKTGLADIVDETTKATPELRLFGMRPISGTTYEHGVRKSLPTVGFRRYNEGPNRGKGERITREFACKVLNPRWECDKALADGHGDGAAMFIADEAALILESTWQLAGRQFYYGTRGGDPKGHPGLIEIYNADDMTVDAEGDDAGSLTSAWLIYVDPRIQWLLGKGGMLDLSDLRIGDITGDNGKTLTGYIQEMLCHLGLYVGDLRNVLRIENLSNQDGHTLTDNMVAEAIVKFPTGRTPTHLFAPKQQIEYLRQSRITALVTNPELPKETNGVTIVPTDSIVLGETF